MTTATEAKVEIEQIDLYHPTVQDVRHAWELLKGDTNRDPNQYLIRFSQPVQIQVDRAHRKKFTEIVVKFFVSKDDVFAYTLHKRTGYDASYLPCAMIESIQVAPDRNQLKGSEEEQIAAILRRRHPNAWTHITPKDVKGLDLRVVNIKSKFPPHIIDQLREAFENKENYHYSVYGERRHLSVETKLCDDGTFKAWYSSEYADCANGAYYFLLNPTTASFREDD